jgi:hypothetical protein
VYHVTDVFRNDLLDCGWSARESNPEPHGGSSPRSTPSTRPSAEVITRGVSFDKFLMTLNNQMNKAPHNWGASGYLQG